MEKSFNYSKLDQDLSIKISYKLKNYKNLFEKGFNMVDKNIQNNINVCDCEHYAHTAGSISKKGDCYASLHYRKDGYFESCEKLQNCSFKQNARKQQALLRIENLIGCIKETYYEKDLDDKEESNLIDYCDQILDVIDKVKDRYEEKDN